MADAVARSDRPVWPAPAAPLAVARRFGEHALSDRDAVQLRATWRIGWELTRPNWIDKFTTLLGPQSWKRGARQIGMKRTCPTPSAVSY